MRVFKELKFVLFILIATLLVWGVHDWEKIFTNLEHFYYQLRNKDESINFESKIETFSFSSKAFNDVVKETKVYLPKEYLKNKEKKFPVLYLLHGFPGSDSDWLINANLQKQLDDLINNQKIPPLIVVFPDGNGPAVHDTQYLNATKISQPGEDYVIGVVNEVDSHYSTIGKRESRAIGGLSAGAYGAMNIGLHRNDMFAVIISHSGYFINDEEITKRLLNPDDIRADYNNPLRYIEGISLNSETFIYMDIGMADKKSYITENEEMDKILTRKGIEHVFNITKGWHDWEVWRKNISESLTFLGKNIKT